MKGGGGEGKETAVKATTEMMTKTKHVQFGLKKK